MRTGGDAGMGKEYRPQQSHSRLSDEYLYAMLDCMAVAVIATDEQGLITFLNPKAEKLTGWVEAEAKGKALSEVYRPFSPEEKHPAARSLRQEGPISGIRCSQKLETRSGAHILIEQEARPIIAGSGESIGTIIYFQDKSCVKNSADELLRHLQQTEALQISVEKLNKAREIQDVYAAALMAAGSALRADRSAILTFDEHCELHFRAIEGLSRQYCEKIARRVPWAISNLDAQPLAYPDINSCNLPPDTRKILADEGIQALAYFPLLGDGVLLGQFLAYYDAPQEFTKNLMSVGRVLADNLSTALRRLQTTKKLQESERKYRSIFENVAEGIYQSTPDGKLLTVNPAFVRMLGYDRAEELIGDFDAHGMYMNREDRERLSREVDEKGSLRGVELVLKRKDGSPLVVLMNDRAVRDADGNLLYFEGTIEDITEQKQLENALREISDEISSRTGKEFFHSLVEFLARTLNASHAMVGKIADSQRETVESLALYADGKIIENIIYRLTGTPCEKVFDNSLCYFPSQIQDKFPADTFLVEAGVESYIGTPLFDSKGDCKGLIVVMDRKPLDRPEVAKSILRIFASRAAGELERLEAEAMQRRLEQQLRQTQKWESLGVLAGGVAHDFNNLLSSILGNASLALIDLPESSPARECLEHIELASHRAAELINQLLVYAGQGKLKLETVDVGELIREMADLLFVSISKKIKLEFAFSETPLYVRGDPGQLRQVVMNLVANAAEAIGDRPGRIRLATRLVQSAPEHVHDGPSVSGRNNGANVCFEVEDDGAGMAQEDISRIFDPFYTTKFTGRGLGLAVVLGIVKGHNGHIYVQSEPGKGTKFTLQFPTATGTTPKRKPAMLHSGELQYRGTVLVVDDEEAVCSIASRILKRIGFDVFTAANGVEGLALFKEHASRLTLVLLDLTMPGMDGIEAFKAMMQVSDRVPVILSSGFNEQMASRRFCEPAPAGFIHKPYTPAELAQRIREVLEKFSSQSKDARP